MNCIINVFLTDNRILYFPRGNLGNPSPVDVFKYVIASLEPLQFLFDRIYINCELDIPYKDKEKEVEEFVRTTLSQHDIRYSRTRCYIQKDWQDFLSKVLLESKDDYFWFSTNHDHVFIDSDTKFLENLLEEWRTDSAEYKAVYQSHLPETFNMWYINPPNGFGKHQVWCTRDMRDGTLFVNRKILEYWFFRKNYGNTPMPRPDFNGAVEGYPETKIMCPLRETFRHFDGYHASDACPALSIPDGIFEDKLKVSCYYDENHVGANINPLRPYKIYDRNGVDFQGLESDIPLFWRKHILELDINPSHNLDILREHRNESYKNKHLCYCRWKQHENNSYTIENDERFWQQAMV